MGEDREVKCTPDYIAIKVDDYAELIREDLTLHSIISVLFKNASLSWDKKDLDFDERSLCCVLKVLCTGDYYSTLRRLQKQEEEKDGTDKGRE